jgi:hypothetical protein
MSRVEWLKWYLRYGDPETRFQVIGRVLAFEVYSLGCLLFGHKVTHWLKEQPLPAGKYLRVRRPVPFGVRLLDKAFSFGEQTHMQHVPYLSVAAERMKMVGDPFEVVEISYQLSLEGSGD